MKILGLNRVELLLEDRDLDKAVETFNTQLGFQLCAPLTLGEGIRSSVDFGKGLELVSPADETSPVFPVLRERGDLALDVDQVRHRQLRKAHNGEDLDQDADDCTERHGPLSQLFFILNLKFQI